MNENGGSTDAPDIDPVAAIQAELLAVCRRVEAQFPTANVILFISEPGCGMSDDPAFNFATTAQPEDVLAVLRAFLEENKSDH